MQYSQQETIHAHTQEQEPEGQGIPFHMVRELFVFLIYGTLLSVGIKLLHYTGCRIAELDNMKKSQLQGNWLYWKCGKNQTGWRKEYLPDCFIAEMEFYWKHHKTSMDSILGVSSATFTRYFRKEVRPLLSKEWRLKESVLKNGRIVQDYKYKLKGFRKNFATLLFWYFWKKYEDAGVAVERVSKRMKHESKHVTCNAYIETAEQIEAEKYANLMPFEIVQNVSQSRITEWI